MPPQNDVRVPIWNGTETIYIWERDKKLLNLLATNKIGYTRTQLVQKTGIPRSTVFDSLRRLQIARLAYWEVINIEGQGRPHTNWMKLHHDDWKATNRIA